MKVTSNGIPSVPVAQEDRMSTRSSPACASAIPWKNPNTGEVEEILIESTETRDQPKNKERALARLRTFIYDKEHSKYVNDIASRRKSLVSTGDRSAKIRTYNFPQGRVTDHRIGYTTHDLQGFMNGNIQDMIDHLTVAENAEKLKESEL
jgi:peptide chain release factor 1